MGAVYAVLALLLVVATPAAARDQTATLRCGGDLLGEREPVLLIHGTGVTAEENWAWGYENALRDRGHGVCTIDLPKRATVDLQTTLPLTAAAIREVSGRAGGRRIALIGHSQGASQAVFALRFWPALARHVDDVVGLAGAYDRGSEAIGRRCADPCHPPFHQISPGSKFLAALATRPPPPGPSITAIGTLYDKVITPQPEANAVPGGTSIQIQDICPGRSAPGGLDHLYIAADAVAYALAIDALDNPGAADPERVSGVNCALAAYPGADVVRLGTLTPKLLASGQGEGAGPAADREPRLRCPFGAGCDVLTSFKPLSRRVPRGEDVWLRVRVARTGRVRLRLPGRMVTPSERVRPGLERVPIGMPALSPGRWRAVVQARSLPGTPWASVGRVRLRVVAQPERLKRYRRRHGLHSSGSSLRIRRTRAAHR